MAARAKASLVEVKPDTEEGGTPPDANQSASPPEDHAPAALAPSAQPGAEAPGQGDQATAAVDDALGEIEQAAAAATGALAEEGIKAPSSAPARAPERPRFTLAQRVKIAQKQRAYGRKLLERNTAGFASVTRTVRINNAALALTFERFFPHIDMCAYLLVRSGSVALGEKGAEKLLDQLMAMAREALSTRVQELGVAKVVAERCAERDGYIMPSYTKPAFERPVQVRSPQALVVLDIFSRSDELLTELDALYWNGERTIGDVNDEILRAKQLVTPLFRLATSTIRNLHTRMRERFAPPTQPAQAPAAEDEGLTPA